MMPVLWLLGLSGSGKTTLGSLLRLSLESRGYDVDFIDEDRFRHSMALTPESGARRHECVDAMRGHVLQSLAQGNICIVAAVTPGEAMRRKNREQLPLYREIWVRCSLAGLVARDPKGLYARASRGEAVAVCGLTESFDEPVRCHHVIDTDRLTLAECYDAIRRIADDALEDNAQWRSIVSPAPRAMPLPEAGLGRHC